MIVCWQKWPATDLAWGQKQVADTCCPSVLTHNLWQMWSWWMSAGKSVMILIEVLEVKRKYYSETWYVTQQVRWDGSCKVFSPEFQQQMYSFVSVEEEECLSGQGRTIKKISSHLQGIVLVLPTGERLTYERSYKMVLGSIYIHVQ